LIVGGLDGCRGGWILATLTWEPERDDQVSTGAIRSDVAVDKLSTFAEAIALVRSGALLALGVDMPIGLPDSGQREADRAARRRLGRRRSSVFPTPVRSTLQSVDYADALARSRAIDGRGLSKQAFNLLPRIIEVDELMTPALQSKVFECHPETCFATLAGHSLTTVKRHADGLAERNALLSSVLGDVTTFSNHPPTGSKPDDVLDALVIATVAKRFLAGNVERLGDGSIDRRGLRMEIVV